MSLVDVHNEWDPLEEVIIGTVTGARVPVPDKGLFTLEYADYGTVDKVPSGPYAQHIVEETEEELSRLCAELTKIGVKVRRPEARDHAAQLATPDWQTDGFYDYCPRDVFLTVGSTVIETPMVLRSRFLEPFAYKNMLLEFFESGARWISAPKPRLGDDMYDMDAEPGRRLGNLEPAFDAANMMRCGTDLLYLVSDSGNELGWKWLQSALGDTYKVHPCRDIYTGTHIDTTIVPLRPGLVLLNPERVNDKNMPDYLRDWDHLWCPEMTETEYEGKHPYGSPWVGMNLLVINEDLVVADERQPALLRALEKRGIDVLPMRLTHARTLGGSFHCVSLDIRRTGTLETYR
ncbi:scyllo-inosamine-4-phosphate amidinotransferase [Streptomyces bingchenggensis BCW-1]|uniref:Scyllo-inosamine-4-phosphate amidinotransferase n=1 Tax=Streptomyces bingchenggensis (strain BCW-1) TaxID=749414 RepID=D7C288_STRBB|nr:MULTISPECIES: inosamine-phosphate amidinotransferase [Streptomyces]ADI03742.1 scyllo-inosamine-4-phosphate amidinotransferase [Streptomyces bingchenggensis BCW-1]